jgi:hypothetical protein
MLSETWIAIEKNSMIDRRIRGYGCNARREGGISMNAVEEPWDGILPFSDNPLVCNLYHFFPSCTCMRTADDGYGIRAFISEEERVR